MHLKVRSKGSVEMNASTTAIRKNHAVPIAIVLFAAAAALAAFALTATANAASGYNSSLGSNRPVAEKVSSSKVAAYTSRAAKARAKARAARLAKARRAAALRRARAAALAASTTTVASTGTVSDAERAQQLLTALIAQHPILAGSTVEIGNAQGYQAISYFQTGRIVISPTHSASIDRIMNHEIWHIIDWRDNGRIDWGENVPPAQ